MTEFRLHTVALAARSAALRLDMPGARYHLPAPVAWRLEGGEKPLTGAARTVVLALHGLKPATQYVFHAEGFAPLAFETPFCAGLVDIRDCGADPASVDNSAAIAEAVAMVPEGGTLRIPKGKWWSRPVFLRSDMTVELCEGAELRAVGGRGGWPKLPARDPEGRMLGSWEGLPEPCFAALLTAIGARNLTICGPGIVDGGGDRGDWWSWPKETRDGARRPRTMHLIGCEDVTLMGIGVRNSPSWTVHPQGCRRLVAAALAIENPPDSPNTDGFNPESCEGVVLEGLRFSVGDDCIAIKAGKRAPGAEDHLAPTRDVAIRHCLMERGHGGVVLGSEMSGGIHDVRVEHCEMVATDRGLRIKTRRGRGGEVSGIAMRDVTMDGVHAAITANAFYFCDPDGHDDWVQSREAAPVGAGTPLIRDIEVSDLRITGLTLAAVAALGLPEAPIRDIRLRNISVEFAPDAVPGDALMAEGVEKLRHAGIWSQWAEIDAEGCDIAGAEGATA